MTEKPYQFYVNLKEYDESFEWFYYNHIGSYVYLVVMFMR